LDGILLTQNSGAILGPIAKLLGIIINFIFDILDKFGIPNVGLSIILFTIFIYLILLPLTFKQQKFSKMSAVMNPEIQAVQAKYKGKKDNESMQKQNEELQEVYQKYGVSPTGSCLQLIIQMPILFALYRVIYNIPAYITKVYESLSPVAEIIAADKSGPDFIQSLSSAKYFAKQDFTQVNTIIDVLNRATGDEWSSIKENIPAVSSIIDSCHENFLNYYSFGAINIADSPSVLLKNGFESFKTGSSSGAILVIVGALLIPLLAALTQWLNVIFMPQPQNNNDQDNPMAQSMKSMNLMMPIMSAVFCFTLPAGLGLYWIASAVVRSIQQVFINKYFDNVGIDKIIEKNMEKAAKKNAKKKNDKQPAADVSKNASIKTKNINSKYSKAKDIEYVEKNTSEAKEGSLRSKANLVKKYNERH